MITIANTVTIFVMTHDAFVSNNIKIPLVEEQEALYQIVRKAM